MTNTKIMEAEKCLLDFKGVGTERERGAMKTLKDACESCIECVGCTIDCALLKQKEKNGDPLMDELAKGNAPCFWQIPNTKSCS